MNHLPHKSGVTLQVPSLKSNSSPLKMVVYNRNLLFQGSIFRGENAVSFRVPGSLDSPLGGRELPSGKVLGWNNGGIGRQVVSRRERGMVLLMPQKSGKLTSWYGKYPKIYRVSAPCQVVGNGISEPSTVGMVGMYSFGSGLPIAPSAKLGIQISRLVKRRFEKNGFGLYHLITFPKNPWTLQWKGLNLYSRGPGPQISHFWGVRILRVIKFHHVNGQVWRCFPAKDWRYWAWWQLMFLFSPWKLGKFIKFDEHIFQTGWFNHQLVITFIKMNHYWWNLTRYYHL